ncbi:MAG TPA: YfhO family protein [Saprospiraceae bacterium]|nr:YfhO family protein [Saprospiraceae bacterium]
MKLDYKNWIPYIVSILVILLVCIFYFFPQFENKVVPQGDIVQYKGMSKEITDYRNKTGEEALWTNSMFGGMPAYQISTSSHTNLLQYPNKWLKLGFNSPAGVFIMGMIGFFILLVVLGVNPWISLILSICFGLGTGNMLLYDAGHNTKLATIMASPIVILGFILTMRKRYLIGGSIFAFGMGINLLNNHPQMTYYLGLVLGIWYLIYAFSDIKSRDFISLGKSSLVLLIGLVLGIGSSATKLMLTYEYGKDTMRGKPILEKTVDSKTNSSSHTDGLAWDYAMQWSNGSGDLLSSFVPYAMGGGSSEWISKESNLAKLTGSRKEIQAPMYFGSLPFTSGPYYFGNLVFVLFILSIFFTKGVLRYGLITAVIFTFLISLGKNFEFFNRLLFDYMPMFNKFRTPNSVLSVTGIFIPLGAALGLAALFKSDVDKAKYLKILRNVGIAFVSFYLIMYILGPSFMDFRSAGDARIGQPQIIDALVEDRMAMYKTSVLSSLLITVAGLGVIYLFVNQKMGKVIALAVLGIIAVFDLVHIDTKYLSYSSFETAKDYDKIFLPRNVDTQILADKDPNFRVYDETRDPFNSAMTSYWHKTVGGYHAAKLQRYQDMIDYYISKGNFKVFNMLNTKYFITKNASNEDVVQINPAALGNAWFVNQVLFVDTNNAEIDSIANIDPAGQAVVKSDFKNIVKNVNNTKNGDISLKEYGPNRLVYNCNTASDQFAVFSEIWYGDDKGWKAYIDGTEVPIVRANYILRALDIPSGEHEIVFEFKPEKFFLGEKLSLIFSTLILLLLAFVIFAEIRKAIKKPLSIDESIL